MPENRSFKLSEYDETIRAVLDSGGEFRIYPRGTSMLPLLVQGRDSVSLVKPDGNLKRNDIAFYLRDNGQYVLHRVIKAENDSYTLCGDNQTKPETGINNSHIIGVVAKIYRKDKVITINSKGYKIYLFLWQSIVIRKIFFKFRHLKNKIYPKKDL